jgi:Protein of unknown function (DUF3592)
MFARVTAMLRLFTTAQLSLIVLTFVVVYWFSFTLFFATWHRYERLAHVGARTSGLVIAKEPKNHASIRYEYNVDGTRYEDIMTAGWMDIPTLDEIRVGQTIVVTYWPDRPSVSTPGNPHKLSEYWLGPLVGAPLVFAFFSALGVALSLKGVTFAQLITYLTNRCSQPLAAVLKG